MENNRVDYNTKVLEVKGLKKYFYHGAGKNKLTVPAVDGLTFDVYKREVFGLVGESGCGKTTTGRTIIKLLSATEGIAKLNGEIVVAGYEEHKREIQRIKEEAAEKILQYDERKFKEVQIKRELKEKVDFLKLDIQKVKKGQVAEIKTAKKPIEDYKQLVYATKNQYDIDVEKINYSYFIEHQNIEELTSNLAKLDYERELRGLKNGYKRKLEGLKDSAALNQATIDKRIAELEAQYEVIYANLEKKYEPLIEENASHIISKEEAKKRIAIIKAERKEKLDARKVKYNEEKAKFVKPNQEAVKAAVEKVKADNKAKIEKMKAEITALTEQAKKDIAALPTNKERNIDEAEMKLKIQEIVDWRNEEVRKKKDIIHELKSINSSKDALLTSRKMQMIFQDPISSLNPRMTVQEIIGEGLVIQGGFTKEEIKEKVGEVLEIVGLSREYAARYPHEFSGGQRQRIGVARALIMDPDFIIADEPISALDVSIRAQVINLLSDLKERLGLTIMFIAHDLSVVRFFCDRIAVMYNGKIVELAEAEELFINPMHPYTRSLLSSIPQPDPDYERNRTRLNYSPMMHNYRYDKPSLQEVGPSHYVYANAEEFEKLKAEYDQNNSAKKSTKGDK